MLQGAYFFLGIKSLTQVVKIANADISVMMRISLNGTSALPGDSLTIPTTKDSILIFLTVRTVRGTVASVLSYG